MIVDSTNPAPDARYELLRSLGEGASGAVYLALDRETREEVAIKKLFRMDQRSVMRFKREFRSLADLRHPNLIKLYDLQHASDAWFLTMEFIDGTDLRRGLMLAHGTGVTQDELLLSTRSGAAADSAKIAGIASAFHQLASGVRAIHQAGMLHRDLKPTNVMIAKTGRVVVLDFGLARELRVPANDVTLEGTIAGTPAYMPPEQALGQDLTEASDWYAFGVMLYEVLAGALPFEGRSAIELIQKKLALEAPAMYAMAAPRPLAELCLALLQRDPAQRPAADYILGVLADARGGSAPHELSRSEDRSLRTETLAAPARLPLFGRAVELEQLTAALAATDENRSVVVHIRGPSGSGKSSLLEHFLDQIDGARSDYVGGPLVLRSRCYESEAMPFKALDGVVDALASYLAHLDDFEVAHALPNEVAALTQVFPVFERLPAVQRLLAEGNRSRGEATRVRRRAEDALRELLMNVARRRTLVLWIDDLQWGDLDSASVIQDWLQRPADAPVLLALSYRSEELATSPCLRALMGGTADPPRSGLDFEINLAPLRDTDVEALCHQRLGAQGQKEPVVARIVREAHGNPFLALQLTALAQAKLERGDVDLEALSVEELVVRTSALLPPAARNLLDVLAVAGRPLVPQLALSAAEIERDGRSHIHALQSLRLVRTRHVAGMRLLEVYHDRVREAVQASLSEAQRMRVYERLLRTVEASGRSDPGWMHELAMGAGQRVLALRYGTLAAEIASSSLAFERAAELYARCVTLTEARTERAKLWAKLGSVLTRCRRGVQAAEAYLKASEYVEDAERVPLLQLAASHLLRSGRFEAGEQLVQRVLATLDIDIPETQTGMYAAIGLERARLAFYAATVKPRDAIRMQPHVLRRAELYGTFAIETQNHELLRAVLFQARAMRMAYQYGESTTIARALCLTATISCMSGTSEAAKRAQLQLAEADALCQHLANQSLKVELLSARALCALLVGHVTESIAHAYAAEEIYETRSAGGDQGDYYYMFAVRAVRIGALQTLGRHITAATELRESLSLARATDNRAAILQATLAQTTVEQVLERCAKSRERLDRERSELPQSGVGPLHVLHMAAVLRAACMNREHDWALAVVEMFWNAYVKSPLRRSAYFAYLLHVNHARLLLHRFVAHGKQGDPEQLIRDDLRWLSNKAPEPFRAPSRSRILARLAFLRVDRALAAKHFRESAAQHAAIGSQDEAARDRYALGYVLDDEEGALLQVGALSALRELGIIEPAQDMRGYYPEMFRDAESVI